MSHNDHTIITSHPLYYTIIVLSTSLTLHYCYTYVTFTLYALTLIVVAHTPHTVHIYNTTHAALVLILLAVHGGVGSFPPVCAQNAALHD